jgi:hypothetical protein
MVEIQGTEFSLWWDVDRAKLKGLSFDGRVEWLRKRIDEVLFKPLAVMEKAEHETRVWLAVTELICGGIEAIAGFYGTGHHGPTHRRPNLFCHFVSDFMDKDFSKTALNAKGQSQTYCRHLQDYFRGGLDHGFSIEWGGLWHDGEDGTVGYLRKAGDGNGIAVDPRMLLNDFRQAIHAYFVKLATDGANSTIGNNFQKRFTAILEHRSRTR